MVFLWGWKVPGQWEVQGRTKPADVWCHDCVPVEPHQSLARWGCRIPPNGSVKSVCIGLCHPGMSAHGAPRRPGPTRSLGQRAHAGGRLLVTDGAAILPPTRLSSGFRTERHTRVPRHFGAVSFVIRIIKLILKVDELPCPPPLLYPSSLLYSPLYLWRRSRQRNFMDFLKEIYPTLIYPLYCTSLLFLAPKGEK